MPESAPNLTPREHRILALITNGPRDTAVLSQELADDAADGHTRGSAIGQPPWYGLQTELKNLNDLELVELTAYRSTFVPRGMSLPIIGPVQVALRTTDPPN